MPPAYSKAHVDCVARVLRQADRVPEPPVPSLILDSWRRSLEHHRLDPGSLQGPRILTQTRLRECRERAERFLHLAGEAVSRLHGQVRGAGYCVLLTDAQGRTIDYRVEPTLRHDCRRAGLDLGTCWSEGEEGTCGVAAVLTNGVPVTVHKRDHFRAAFIGLTCSAAPIYDPQGALLGVLDVSALESPDDRRSQHLIRQMTVQSARDIENAFFMHSTRGQWVLRAHPAPGYVDSQPDYLFAWDADGRLCALNPAARRYLRARLGHLPRNIGEVFDLDLLRAAADEQPRHLAEHGLYVRLSTPARAVAVAVPGDDRTALDPRIAERLRLAVRVKDRDLPVLIHGETGAGKEVFARQVHEASARRDKPFVAVNCAALPEGLIESELFGYAAGAFTGADRQGKRGLLQQADGGTLFLDEIGDMPLGLQTRLLRVLAEGEVTPLGAARRQAVDLQVICASHRDLPALVAAGQFREDLYFRLSGARFDLPPLRDRHDKLALINRLLDEEAARGGLRPALGEAALQCLLAYAWPGNVRQLRHALRYACAVCAGDTLRPQDLPAELHGGPFPAAPDTPASPERQALLDALVRHRWQPSPAAQALGISRATLYRRVKQHGIDMPRAKRPAPPR